MSEAGDESNSKIAIVGGGIAGLALAIGLKHNNVPFHLYESAHAFGEIGAGVSFNACALDAMKRIDPALIEGFDRQVTYNRDLKDSWFEFRWGTADNPSGESGTLIANLQGPSASQTSVHRARFLDEMVKLVPETSVTFSKRAVRVVDEGSAVLVEFADGSSARHAGVIGCDGIKSHVRDSLLGPEYAARFTGKIAYRGIFPMDQAADLLGDHQARNAQMHLARGGHVLTFPIAHGATMNVVAFRSKESWDDEQWVLPINKEELEHEFDGWGDTVRNIISLMHKPDVWALFDHPAAPTYTRNRIALLGDAAHASTPHQGSGAGMALEDAFIMSNLLGAIKGDKARLKDAFSVFDELRRVRSQRLVTTSRETGLLWDLELPGIGDDMEKMRADIDKHLNWIWNHDLGKELEYGLQLLKEREISLAGVS